MAVAVGILQRVFLVQYESLSEYILCQRWQAVDVILCVGDYREAYELLVPYDLRSSLGALYCLSEDTVTLRAFCYYLFRISFLLDLCGAVLVYVCRRYERHRYGIGQCAHHDGLDTLSPPCGEDIRQIYLQAVCRNLSIISVIFSV